MANDGNGLTPDRRGQSETGPDPDLAPESAPTQVVERSGAQPPQSLPYPPVDPRRVLWRDSAMLLVLVVVGLLAAQTFLPGINGQPTDSSIPSPITLRSLAPGVTLAPGETLGPIIDPSLGVDATPTPIPVITLGPPTPSPEPSGSPKPSVKPSVKPSAKPSIRPSVPPTIPPTIPPTPTPTDTPTPDPQAHVSCDAPVGLEVTCHSTSTNIQNNSEAWDMEGSGTLLVGGPGSSSITWLYDAAGTYTVTLMVTGLDGISSSTDTTSVTVP
jgi:hypothetical protein